MIWSKNLKRKVFPSKSKIVSRLDRNVPGVYEKLQTILSKLSWYTNLLGDPGSRSSGTNPLSPTTNAPQMAVDHVVQEWVGANSSIEHDTCSDLLQHKTVTKESS